MSNSDDGAPIAPDTPTAPDTSNVIEFPSPPTSSQTPLQHNHVSEGEKKNTHTHERMTRARGKGKNTKRKGKKKAYPRKSQAQTVDIEAVAVTTATPKIGTRGADGKLYKLTDRQDRFCQQYLICNSGSEAYRKVYDCSRSKPAAIRVNASRLLLNPNVQERLAQLKAIRDARTTLSRAWVIERLIENVELGLGKRTVKLKKADKEGGTYEVEVTSVDQAAANRALELLGKESGMFVDRREIGTPGDFARMNDEELRQYVEKEQAEIVERMKRTGTDG